MRKAGIIGGSGFIGSYITKKFLEEGYRLKVSTTDISKKEKYEHLLSMKGADHIEIVPLNTEDKGGLKKFVKDCEILVHCGTPFKLEVDNPEKELFEPTIKGTENFLSIISKLRSLKKVVFMASVASYNGAFPLLADGRSPDHIYTEDDTPFVHEKNHPYAQAKHYAAKAVKKFTKEHPGLGFEIVSVSPTFVVGKPLSQRQDSMSVDLQFLLKNKIASNPFLEMLYQENVEFAMVDVEDVAAIVFKAATTKGINGKNYLLSSESWKVSDISLMLNKKAPKGAARNVYSNRLVKHDLGVHFNPARIPLNNFD